MTVANVNLGELKKAAEALDLSPANITAITDGEVTQKDYRNAINEAVWNVCKKIAQHDTGPGGLKEKFEQIERNEPSIGKRVNFLRDDGANGRAISKIVQLGRLHGIDIVKMLDPLESRLSQLKTDG